VLILSILQRFRVLKNTSAYRTIDQRIRAADFRITMRSPGAQRVKKLSLSNIYWVVAFCAVFMSVGVLLLCMFAIKCISGEWSTFLVVPFLFSFACLAVAIGSFLKLLEIMLAQPLIPQFLKKLAGPSFLNRSLLPNKQAFDNLFMYSFAVFVLFIFSMAALMYAIMDWQMNFESIMQFIFSLVCAFIGFSVITVLLRDYQREKRKRKKTFDLDTIEAIQKGLLVVGHFFGALVLVGGLLVIAFFGANRFRLTPTTFELPWVSILWTWWTISDLVLFHQDTREFYPRGWSPPFLMRLTGTISIPFRAFPPLNLLWLIGKSIDSFLFVLFRLLGIPNERIDRGGYTLPDAKSLADLVAAKRDSGAYLFALEIGDEGITLKDHRAQEWKFSYYLPKRNRRLDIVVAKGKVQAKRSKRILSLVPERLPEEWIDPVPVLESVCNTLRKIFSDLEKESVALFLYLPASRHAEEGGEQAPMSENPCWLVSVLGADMELLGNFYVDAQNYKATRVSNASMNYL
jgi:hypothetical protein